MPGLEMKYFVLKPRSKSFNDLYAHASREAMKAYAEIIRYSNEILANELIKWCDREYKKERKGIFKKK